MTASKGVLQRINEKDRRTQFTSALDSGKDMKACEYKQYRHGSHRTQRRRQ